MGPKDPATRTPSGGGRTRNAVLAVVALNLVLFATAMALMLLAPKIPSSWGSGSVAANIGLFLAMLLSFVGVGAFVALRRPDARMGWLLLLVGTVWELDGAMIAFVAYGLVVRHLPLDTWVASFEQAWWVPMIGLTSIYVPLLFPDGRVPSPRWRRVAIGIAVMLVVCWLVALLTPGPLAGYGIDNRFGIEALRGLLVPAAPIFVLIPAAVVVAFVSLAARYRGATGLVRLQLRWLIAAALTVTILSAIAMAASLFEVVFGGALPSWAGIAQDVALASLLLIPIAVGIAVLRYRLYEIDVVIRKAVIAGVIAAFFVGAYAVLVGGVGAVLGSRGPILSFAAAVVVALLFQPILSGARRFADRVVYGKRATPYEVLAQFGERVAETYAADDALARMAKVLSEAVGAERASVSLLVEGTLRPIATWPGDAPATRDDYIVDVRHQGAVLGALAVSMPTSDPLDPARTKLVDDLAAQAGLVLHNVGLTAELRKRLDDLQAAQQRLVVAQDAERRRLERNIHDGAQQQLVAIGVKLGLAESLLDRDIGKVAEMLRQLKSETLAALSDLRDLARGIYPPLLSDKGLVAALEAQVVKGSVPATVRAQGLGRYPPSVEAAVYFSCLEALQNVAKYAAATSASITLEQRDAALVFAVEDDGAGFDPNATGYGTGLQGMADRLGALGGRLEVASKPGSGTTVRGVVPVNAAASEASDDNGQAGRIVARASSGRPLEPTERILPSASG